MIRNEPSNRLRLQQKLAPQLIQSLRLLQMSTFDLAQEVKQQIELNPLLKEVGELREEWDEELREREEGLEPEEELPEDPEEVYWDAMLTDQFDAGAYNSERTEYDPNWEANREPQANRITAMPPLQSLDLLLLLVVAETSAPLHIVTVESLLTYQYVVSVYTQV